MISKISNENQVSFVFMLILFCAYVVSSFIASGFYEDIITTLFDFMITLFIFLKLKETRNLKTYWIYILLGLTCWVASDTMWMLYDKVDFPKQFLSKVNFIQISYVVSYFMFAFSAFYILIKNLKNLLFALENTELNLVIVGKRDGFITSDSDILEIIEKNNLTERIFFTGYVKDTDIAAIYNLAKLFVFPSLYEGFGIPPLEAQACGCPVVCSNAASLPEVCGDSVLYFDPHNVEDIRSKIQAVLNDENLRNELCIKGFENIKRFSWERSAKQIIEIMEKLR